MKQWKEGRWQQVGTRRKKPGDRNEEGAVGGWRALFTLLLAKTKGS